MGHTWVSVVAGFFAGIAEILVGHPFDTVKTRMQTQAVSDRIGDPVSFRGPLHLAVGAIRREGLLGLYRGLGAPLIQNALGVALLFGAMDWLRVVLGASIFSPGAFVLACCLIGCVESFIYCPLDHVKARLQVAPRRGGRRTSRSGQSSSIEKQAAMEFYHAACEIVRARGLLFLYYGLSLQLLKEMAGNVALFGTYDWMLFLLWGDDGHGRQRGPSRHAHPEGAPWWAILPAGSLAGMAYFAIGYPFDTLKSRLQTDSLTLPRYRGVRHCIAVALEEKHAIRELYTGLSVCLMRAVPGSAVQFIVFELVSTLLGGLATLSEAVKLRSPHDFDHLLQVDYMTT